MNYREKRNSAFTQINERRQRPWSGEEEVRLAWVSALENVLGVHFDAERARVDSSYNNVIIEFKAPGFFRGSKASTKFLEATDNRLLPYIKRLAETRNIPEEDFIGIAIDGEHICFAKVENGSIETQHLIEFSEYSVGLVIHAVEANFRRDITIENLLQDFGHGSSNAIGLMQALSDSLSDELAVSGNSKIKMLFEEWRSLYGQVADMSALHLGAINQELCFAWNGEVGVSIPGRLFVIHTYNSLLIKLLAAEIVSAHGLASTKQPAQSMASEVDDSALISMLSCDIEKAGIFSQAGIEGFVEEAIFSWYLDVAADGTHSSSLVSSIRDLLASLSLYRTDRLFHTRDVLRDLYQGLVPGRLRQSLGEFYTPDWLVDFTLEEVRQDSWLECRVLDPTCGSGAFLLSVIRHKVREAKALNLDPSAIVENLCATVWGFDLNPLAVQTARVNFLMELAPLLKQAPGIAIEIPVLLADAIYSPAPNPNPDENIVQYQIGSEVAGLDILLPSELAFERDRLDRVFEFMGEAVEGNSEFEHVSKALVSSGDLTAAESATWFEPLKYTYDQILDLHRQNWNGIWFRIVRNFFWSATAGHFDVVLGNPPWVRWSKLPTTYRNRVKPTCESYGIFSRTKRHGGNELDISAIITYTTADKWLKTNGKLGFVLTGTLFKNPSSAGFRVLKLNDQDYLHPCVVDDLKALKSFPDASNHTTVAVFTKSKVEPQYPIPYRIWSAVSGSSSKIPPALPLDAVKARVRVDVLEAAPVSDNGSPWAVLSPGRWQALRKLSGKCEWTAGRKGITADLNGVFFVPILQDNGTLVKIRSRPEAGKKDIGPPREAWVEPDLLYPLLKGAGDFEACYLRLDKLGERDRLFTFTPNTGIGREDYSDSAERLNSASLRKTKRWFNSFRVLLEDRSTYKRQMRSQGASMQDVYNVGEYTFAPWKVVWPEMSSRFYAAVAGSATVPVVGVRPYVPDHKVYFCAFDDKDVAYYLCGLLNTESVCEWIESHNISIQVGDVFKHLDLPEYDSTSGLHRELSSLSEQAHNEHSAPERARLVSKVRQKGEEIIRAVATV